MSATDPKRTSFVAPFLAPRLRNSCLRFMVFSALQNILPLLQ